MWALNTPLLRFLVQSLYLIEKCLYETPLDFGTICVIKKRNKHPWRIVIFSKVGRWGLQFTKCNTRPWVFHTFLILYKWSQIAQSITYVLSPWLYTSVMRRINKFQLHSISCKWCYKQHLRQSHPQFFLAILKWHKIYENLVETNMMLQKIAPILPIAILLKS